MYAIGTVRRVVAFGIPAPQGSKSYKGQSKATGRAIMVESSKKVKPWRKIVTAAAQAACAGMPPLDGPVIVRMIFTMPKPKSAPKTRKTYPSRMPDLSKLARSTEDALTDAGLWKDDARVIEYDRLAKVYALEDPEALHEPGVLVVVSLVTESSAIARARARQP